MVSARGAGSAATPVVAGCRLQPVMTTTPHNTQRAKKVHNFPESL